MRARLRYLRLVAARTRTPLVSAAAALFTLIGIFADPRQEVGATWGLTALLAGALTAWLVAAVLSSEPEPQAEMTTIALGGLGGRRTLELTLVVSLAAVLTVLFIGYPVGLVQLAGREVFDRNLTGVDVVNALSAHVACTLLGGALGMLFSPPRVRRRATAFVAITLTLLALVALAPPGDVPLGPLAIAHQLAKVGAHTVSVQALVAGASCLILGGVAIGLSIPWTRRAS